MSKGDWAAGADSSTALVDQRRDNAGQREERAPGLDAHAHVHVRGRPPGRDGEHVARGASENVRERQRRSKLASSGVEDVPAKRAGAR